MTTERHPDNTLGAWFITGDCICCTLCGEIAPEIFRESDDGIQHIVHTQPTKAEALALAEEAQESCPVDAIESSGSPLTPIGPGERLGPALADG